MQALTDPFDITDGLDSRAITDLTSGLRPRHLDPGDELVFHADDAAVLVSRGKLALTVETDADSHERTVSLIDQGELMVAPPTGWEDETSRITCRAVHEAVVYPVDRARFAAWTADPALAARIVRHLAAQVAERSVTAATALEPGVERRVLLKLQQLAQRYGVPSPEGVRLDMNLTHRQLAGLVGAVRESVTIALGRLQVRGEIIVRKRTIWLPDLDLSGASAGGR